MATLPQPPSRPPAVGEYRRDARQRCHDYSGWNALWSRRATADVDSRASAAGKFVGIVVEMEQLIIWPDPVPCRPENPVQGINRCVALENNTKCPWLNVDYCGIRAEDMADALNEIGLDELTWVVDDDLDPSDVAAAALEVRRADRRA